MVAYCTSFLLMLLKFYWKGEMMHMNNLERELMSFCKKKKASAK